MAGRYDLEQLLADLKEVCVLKLNTKLAALTTEKGDSLSLPEIKAPIAADPLATPEPIAADPGAYFFQRIEKNRANAYPVFLFYAVEDPTADGIGPHTLENYLITFVVVLKDTADGDQFSTRLLRYSRALKEIFEEAYSRNKIRAKLQVSSLSPQSFAIDGLAGSFKGVGVQVRTVIG